MDSALETVDSSWPHPGKIQLALLSLRTPVLHHVSSTCGQLAFWAQSQPPAADTSHYTTGSRDTTLIRVLVAKTRVSWPHCSSCVHSVVDGWLPTPPPPVHWSRRNTFCQSVDTISTTCWRWRSGGTAASPRGICVSTEGDGQVVEHTEQQVRKHTRGIKGQLHCGECCLFSLLGVGKGEIQHRIPHNNDVFCVQEKNGKIRNEDQRSHQLVFLALQHFFQGGGEASGTRCVPAQDVLEVSKIA